MPRALLLSLLLSATASAQAPDALSPDSTLFERLSDDRLDLRQDALRELERQLGPVAQRGTCDQAVAMPALGLGGGLAPAPIPQADLATGLQPAPMPDLCGQPLAVLPDGVRFRTDPLPPSVHDDLGRQSLREQRRRPAMPYDPNDVRFRQRLVHPDFERVEIGPLVAPPHERP